MLSLNQQRPGRSRQRSHTYEGILLASIFLSTGCSHQATAPVAPIAPAPPSLPSEQTKVRAIQNNPGMPEAEKAAIMHSQAAAPPAH